MHFKEDYGYLHSVYNDPTSLEYKKMKIVDEHITCGKCLLDVGMGTGQLIEMEKHKFEKIMGIDIDSDSVKICKERFMGDKHVEILQGNIIDLKEYPIKFDFIVCLDVLEHISVEETKTSLKLFDLILNKHGKLIISVPGIFEKIKIRMGKSPGHKHSHSSYGWAGIIKNSGFKIVSIQTVEFPLLNKEFLSKKAHIFGKCCVIVAEKF